MIPGWCWVKCTKRVLGGMRPDFTDPDWPRRKLFYQAFSGQGDNGTASTLAKMMGNVTFGSVAGGNRNNKTWITLFPALVVDFLRKPFNK